MVSSTAIWNATYLVDYYMSIFFAGELIVEIACFGPNGYFGSPWKVIDAIIVTVSFDLA